MKNSYKNQQINIGVNGKKVSLSLMTEWMFYITIACNFFILLGNPIKNAVMVSYATRILCFSVIIVGVYVVVTAFKQGIDMWTFLFVCLFLLTLVIGLINGVSVLVSRYVNIICFLMLPVYMIVSDSVINVNRIKLSIYVANLGYVGIFVWLYFSEYSHVSYANNMLKIVDELTLGYGNPNETGMYLLVNFLILVITIAEAKHKFLKVFLSIISSVILYFIILTDSRMCLVLSALFIFVYVFKLYGKTGKIIKRVVLVLPFVSACTMLLFPTFFQEWTILGEIADTGRYGIYISALRSIDVFTMFFGNYRQYVVGSNLHNSYLSIFMGCGMIVLSVYLAFLNKTLEEYQKKATVNSAKVSFVAFLIIILHGMVESTFLVSGTVFAGLVGLLFPLMLEEDR